MIRLVNDEEVISELVIRRAENKIRELSLFLETRIQFFILASSVDEARLYNSRLVDSETVINLKLKRRVPWSKVVSEYEDGTIFYNPKLYRNYSLADLVGNFIHEIAHHYNFKHSFNWNKTRKYTTPYYMGYLYEFLTRHYDAFNYRDEMDLADLVTKWRNYINNVIK